jgi:hypothetical protein
MGCDECPPICMYHKYVASVYILQRQRNIINQSINQSTLQLKNHPRIRADDAILRRHPVTIPIEEWILNVCF